MDKTTAKIKVYAKLNLALDITGVDADGYHLLDMINCTVSVYDTLAVSRCDKIAVKMDGVPCGAENTAYRAAVAVRELSGVSLAIDISKGIPFGAGMGGSSADASAVLRFAVDAGLTDEMSAYAAAQSIGSDVVYMMTGGFARVRGRGEAVAPLGDKSLQIAIARKYAGASTADVYRAYDATGVGGVGIDRVLCGSAARYNVLEKPAIELCPSIAELKSRMTDAFGEAVMTGSGSAVCSVVGDAARAREILSRDFCDCEFARLVQTVPRATDYI